MYSNDFSVTKERCVEDYDFIVGLQSSSIKRHSFLHSVRGIHMLDHPL